MSPISGKLRVAAQGIPRTDCPLASCWSFPKPFLSYPMPESPLFCVWHLLIFCSSCGLSPFSPRGRRSSQDWKELEASWVHSLALGYGITLEFLEEPGGKPNHRRHPGSKGATVGQGFIVVGMGSQIILLRIAVLGCCHLRVGQAGLEFCCRGTQRQRQGRCSQCGEAWSWAVQVFGGLHTPQDSPVSGAPVG